MESQYSQFAGMPAIVQGQREGQRYYQQEDLKNQLSNLMKQGLPEEEFNKQALPLIAAVSPEAAFNAKQQIDTQKKNIEQQNTAQLFQLKMKEGDMIMANPSSTQKDLDNWHSGLTKIPQFKDMGLENIHFTKTDTGHDISIPIEKVSQKDKQAASSFYGGKIPTGSIVTLSHKADGTLVGVTGVTLPSSSQLKAEGGGLGVNSAELTEKAKRMLDDATMAGVEIPVPSLGLSSGGRIKYLNSLADELDKRGYSVQDLGVIRASIKADSSALVKVRQQQSAIMSFEKTAEKNLGVLDSTIDALPDSGIPIANNILRSIGLNIKGSTDISKFNAAQQTAINEVSRVLNTANGNGVVSDSARKEVQDILKKGATKKQIRAAMGILVRDMANRKGSFEDQTKEIQSRIHNPMNYLGGLDDSTVGQPSGTKNDPLGIL